MPRRRVSEVSIKVGDIEKAIPVKDGGKAWILVVGAFVCQMLCAGLVQGMGVTFVELQNYFKASATEVGWIGSCLTFSACSIGIVSGALSRHFGCRPVVIFGGILASLSMIASSFAEQLWHLYITILFTGFGCGLVLPAAISVIGFNFQVHYGIANGLQYAGVGVGIMSIPPLFQLLFDLYSWRGTLLLYGAVLLNVCACGLLMNPSPAEKFGHKKTSTSYTAVSTSKRKLGDTVKVVSPRESIDKSTSIDPEAFNTTRKIPDDTKEIEKYCDSKKLMPSSSPYTEGSINDDNEVFEPLQTDSESSFQPTKILGSSSKSRQRESSVRFDVSTNTFSPELSVKIIPIEESVLLKEENLSKKCISGMRTSMKGAAQILGISVFWEHPIFAFFVVAVMMFGFGYASCLLYFIPRAIQDVGVPELEASFLLTVLGSCSLIARLTNGLIVDMGWITPLVFFCISCLVCAVSSFCTPFTHSFFGSVICAGLFGLASGVANPMLAMVSRELVGQKVMASALGIVMLFNGIGSVAGIFTMGYVFDHYGNYNLSFYIAGCDLVLITFLVVLGRAFAKRQSNNRINTFGRPSLPSVTEECTPAPASKSQPIRSDEDILSRQPSSQVDQHETPI